MARAGFTPKGRIRGKKGVLRRFFPCTTESTVVDRASIVIPRNINPKGGFQWLRKKEKQKNPRAPTAITS